MNFTFVTTCYIVGPPSVKRMTEWVSRYSGASLVSLLGPVKVGQPWELFSSVGHYGGASMSSI